MADLAAQKPVRVLSGDEVEQMLASHQLYLKTEYHQGHRADFSSTDLTGLDFAGLDLRGIKMDRRRAPKDYFHRSQSARREPDRRDRTGGAL
jgi:hypothetical protein